ncbi:transcriptional regulator, TetR family protein [Oleiphilus messinensis]|uniref:Transcriptional regulator, TetR family protein n=1 Tax=Oleiphilus messinensis TaxID=141451 RepID=A0A1Y0IBH5_9GAMM|nr:TetR/AcrR family transcriptional regulator [Oleiphilus messinensis]ARU56743.1 transcriptional regulator, TetR family protein [Oleiphilus messinensis]
MARVPRQNRSKATVDAIIQAALMVLAKEGPNAATTRQIADLAGIGVGSLYEYFDNKEAIFEAAAKRFVDDTVAMIQPLAPRLVRMEIRDLIHELLYNFRDFLEKNDQLYLRCARHAFTIDMAVYQEPINRVLMDLFMQYLLYHPELTKLKNIPAAIYCYINGSVYTVVKHLSEENSIISFEELVTALADMLHSYTTTELVK